MAHSAKQTKALTAAFDKNRIEDTYVAAPASPAPKSGFLDPEQVRRVAAQNRHPLFIRERGGRENLVDRMLFPGDRVVGAEHDLAGADLRHQVSKPLRREHHGVEMELVEI